MDELEKLRHLSLVSKVCVEMQNHLGTEDRGSAEFLISLVHESHDLMSFRTLVASACGKPLPDALTASIYRSVPRTFTRLPEDAAAHNLAAKQTGFTTQATDSRGFLGSGIDRERVLKASENENDTISSRTHPSNPTGASSRESVLFPPSNLTTTGWTKMVDIKREEITAGLLLRGKVVNLREYGAFISLGRNGSAGEGLAHIADIHPHGHRIRHPSELLSRGQSVWVKVILVEEQRVSLSMEGIDQMTGDPLEPRQTNAANRTPLRTDVITQNTARGRARGPHRGQESVSGIPRSFMQDRQGELRQNSGRMRRRLPETEQWELTQLAKILPQRELQQHMGGLPSSPGNVEVPTNEMAILLGDEEEQENEVEIELNEDEPAFLRSSAAGHGVSRAQPLSPVRIVKNPDGSMQRAAMTQSALAKNRREERDQKRAALENEMPSDLNLAWQDPVSGERHVAAELRGSAAGPSEVPEWKRKAMGVAPSFGYAKQIDKSIAEQRESLPIARLKTQLLLAIRDNQILVVVGETGSGKSTQMTQYLVEAGYTKNGKKIACTQPRRVAAMSVAKRVAEERGCRLGEEVGYSIRFEDMTSAETEIKYMTDGMLLREVLTDPDLAQYSVIMLDEAHERTIATDVLFGLLKDCISKGRKDLKIIVTSATLDAEKFSTYFLHCPIFTIPGRLFPVEVLFAKEPISDYIEEALMTVIRIHMTEPAGDILLFLTGQEEIDTAAEMLYGRMKKIGKNVPELIILPVYSALPSEMQTRIFDPPPPGSRKVVIATNIAEASLTIDGILYVVDPGFAKQKVYNPKLGMDSLVVAPISQASARQRKGRAGRTGPGKCICLYTESAYMNEMLPTSVPELQRSNLAHTVLTLKAMGINDLLGFDFMDPPPAPYLISAMERLYSLGALDEEGLLTRLGRTMSQFPLDPMLSKMLLASVDLGCSEEILTVVAMLGVQSVFYRPKEKQGHADQKKSKFHQPEGDHLTLLTVYNQWKNNRFSSPWCYENFIQARSLKRALDVRKQLVTIMDRFKLDIVSAGRNYVKIRKAIVSGFFAHAAKKDPQEGYRTLVDGQQVFIHPSSSLFHAQPEWVIYHEVVLTTKEYMREVMAIESKWLVELAPRFFRRGDPSKISRRKRREKIEPLFDKYAQNPNDWRLSKRRRI
ncbi:Putative ATP-dependent RNA helicase DHX8 [Chondrus crispus]|uniref:RNA helicase n=1 Tax=Chondrus crispus TaxID=2769 RepID=R7QMD3_CHOCR|nr:Putative ATP-dependent RNA helicase DHX8 [Chondrus crispus]CDF38530.1 Putative ATP-dependent RNA helicase DHX8 [Chondrus crispus]|eukprot:XP_005718423.1 Putative ATP-dependent RNA helicase DHX8 [Chondrus crispus]